MSATRDARSAYSNVLILRKPYRSFRGDPIPDGYAAIDVTSSGPPEWSILSPFYKTEHPRLDVPGHPGVRAKCVEDVWQGLKFGDGNHPVDMNMVVGNRPKVKKRRIPNVRGHSYGDRTLGLYDARRSIYLPLYHQHLEWGPCRERVEALRDLIRETNGKVALLDHTVHPLHKPGPMSHAWVLKRYLENGPCVSN